MKKLFSLTVLNLALFLGSAILSSSADAQSAYVTIQCNDTNNPQINSQGTNSLSLLSGNVTCTATSYSGIALGYWQYSSNGGPFQNLTGDQVSVAASGIPYGIYQVRAVGTDANGAPLTPSNVVLITYSASSSAQSAYVTIQCNDTNNPNINSNSSLSLQSGNVTCTTTAYSGVALGYWQYSSNGGPFQNLTGDQVTVAASGIPYGTYQVRAIGTDANGNPIAPSNVVTISYFILPAPNYVAANWKNAGLLSIGGIPHRTTQCGSTISPTGITPPASGDDASVINAAIKNCTAGDVVQLAAGTFQIAQSEGILVNKSITLRGTGSCTNSSSPYCQTVVNVYNGAIPDWDISSTTAGGICGTSTSNLVKCNSATGAILVSPDSVYTWGWSGCNLYSTATSCGTTLAADAAQGQTTIQVANTANFSVGMWVLIDENPAVVSTTNPTGGAAVEASPEFLNSSPSPATMRLEGGDEPTSYSFSSNRLNAELHLVTAVGAGPCPGSNCTLTFDDPLTLAFRQSGSHNAQVYWPSLYSSSSYAPFLQQAGVENLSVSGGVNGGINVVFCAYCWVKNTEVYNWMSGAVNVKYSARTQIEFNYFHNCTDCENNGTEYPLAIDAASTETYVDNNIVLQGGKGMVGRGANSAVIAYNYVTETFYMEAVIGDYWLDMDVNGSHYAGTHHFLFEGNWGNNCDSDETHGNATYHTFFRNQCTGLRTTFTDPSNGKVVDDATGQAWGQGGGAASPGPLRTAGPMAFDYWFAFVGNVMGTAGQTTTANGWVYQGIFCGGCRTSFQTDKAIWMSGWVGSEWPSFDPNLTSGKYIFRNGNYDYVHGAIADWAAGYSQNLPNSLYLSSEPAFFTAGTSCTYPWPWVTPTNSPYVQANSCSGSGLPAKARMDAGTPFVQP